MKKSMIKKSVIFILTVTLILSTGVSVTANEDTRPVTVYIDGEQIFFDVEPILENGRTLVPMRYIFEALGANVEWLSETNTAIAFKENIKLEITVGKNEMIKNGEVIALDVPAKLINGRTLVPVRAVSEGMEAGVQWDGELRKVTITNKKDAFNIEKEEYLITELSPEDAQKLKAMEADFRYVFEQELLPQEFLSVSTQIVPYIESKANVVLDIIYEIWDTNLASVVFELQNTSKDKYIADAENSELTTDNVVELYKTITKKLSVDSSSVFEASFDTTPSGKTVALLTFANTEYDNSMLIVSKYIAIVPVEGKCRYFTAEISPLNSELLGRDVWMVCEITEKGRNNYDEPEKTSKEGFLKKIDTIISE